MIERAIGIASCGAASRERGGGATTDVRGAGVGNGVRWMLPRTPGSVHGTSGCRRGSRSARCAGQGRHLVRRFVSAGLVKSVVERAKVGVVRVGLQCHGKDGGEGCAIVEVAVTMQVDREDGAISRGREGPVLDAGFMVATCRAGDSCVVVADAQRAVGFPKEPAD